MAKISVTVTNTYVIDLDKVQSRVNYNALRFAPYAETYTDKVSMKEGLDGVLMYNRAAIEGEDTSISAAFME